MELHLALCHQNTTRYTNNTNTHDPSSPQEETIYHGATSRSLSPKHHQVHQQYKHSRPIIIPRGDGLPWSYISLSVTKTPLGTPTIQTLTTHHHPKRRRSTMELQLALCHQNTTRYTNNTNTHDPSSPQEETIYHGATTITKTPLGTPTIQTLMTHHHPKRRRSTMELQLSPKHHQVHQQYKHS